ncbi:MAG: DEAD/DEAH box helicase, partial [Janthinobacterium sp.]
AMVTLLTESWFEPPPAQGMHLSTLVQQILSVASQKNGIRISPLYHMLCGPQSPFAGLNKADFASLIRHLGSLDLLMQDSSGTLIHGKVGESFVNDYQFYAAFASEEEYRLQAGGRTLGTIPLEQIPKTGQRIVFAGKTWSVDSVHDAEKVVVLSKAPGGAPPVFVALGGQVHSMVTQRMRELLESNHELPFLDSTAQRFLNEGRVAYQAFGLDKNIFVKTSEALV